MHQKGQGMVQGKPVESLQSANGERAKLVQSSYRLEVQGCFVTCTQYSLLQYDHVRHSKVLFDKERCKHCVAQSSVPC